MSCLKKWPPFWRDDGRGNKVWAWRYVPAKVAQTEEYLTQSDTLLRELADTVLELKANTEQLEDVIKRMKDEDDA